MRIELETEPHFICMTKLSFQTDQKINLHLACLRKHRSITDKKSRKWEASDTILQILYLKGFMSQIGQIPACSVALQPLNLLHWNYMDPTFKSSTFWLAVLTLQLQKRQKKESTSLT